MLNIRRDTENGADLEGILCAIRGHGDLNGKEIRQVVTVVAKRNVELLGEKYNDVWITHGENRNYLDELGKCRGIYWFDQNYGYIRMKYEKIERRNCWFEIKESE